MTSKKTGLKRDTIDKFYTCPKVAKECIQHITYHVSINSDIDIVVEPSAGNGSFISEIKQICQNTQFYDIEPEHELVVKQDYLLLNISEIEFPDLHTKIHVIGNPPFGRQSSLAIQFIKKSALFADSISFILPKSFKKDSMQKHFPPRFHLIFQSEIAPNSFLQDDNCVNVPCVFQIWQKMCKERVLAAKLETNPDLYAFVKQDEDPDISFRRVGVNAGAITSNKEDIQEKSIQSHYFIKFGFIEDEEKTDLITKLKGIIYDTDNTVGPKSIGKQEIIREFNKIFC